MIIGGDGGIETYQTDVDGNLVSIGGNQMIFEKDAAEAPDQTEEIEKENEQ